MEKITNLSQAVDYVYAELQKVNPDVSKDDIFDTIVDEIIESMEYVLIDEDDRFLEDNEKNMEAIDDFLQTKIPDYQELLTEIVTDMVSEESLEA